MGRIEQGEAPKTFEKTWQFEHMGSSAVLSQLDGAQKGMARTPSFIESNFTDKAAYDKAASEGALDVQMTPMQADFDKVTDPVNAAKLSWRFEHVGLVPRAGSAGISKDARASRGGARRQQAVAHRAHEGAWARLTVYCPHSMPLPPPRRACLSECARAHVRLTQAKMADPAERHINRFENVPSSLVLSMLAEAQTAPSPK